MKVVRGANYGDIQRFIRIQSIAKYLRDTCTDIVVCGLPISEPMKKDLQAIGATLWCDHITDCWNFASSTPRINRFVCEAFAASAYGVKNDIAVLYGLLCAEDFEDMILAMLEQNISTPINFETDYPWVYAFLRHAKDA